MSEDTALFSRLSGRATAAELAIAEIIKVLPDVGRQLVIQKLEEIKSNADSQGKGEFHLGLAESIEAMLK